MNDKRRQDNLDEETRSEIGQMGGEARAREEDMSELGRKGGEASRGNEETDGRGWHGDSEGHSEAAQQREEE